ncbi:hypothetical protein DIPPA_23943 [Diplonema papillatum]|nr:hypothetical protein DIPPA_23943 [Diplonema papillatum]
MAFQLAQLRDISVSIRPQILSFDPLPPLQKLVAGLKSIDLPGVALVPDPVAHTFSTNHCIHSRREVCAKHRSTLNAPQVHICKSSFVHSSRVLLKTQSTTVIDS